jgi:omega-6 fatty acid desaturase (delta-12 desaturase)
MAGSSFYDLPRVLHWFTGNIGYHHIHHLDVRIPNYRLRDCFESSPRLRAAPRLTLASSLGCARLKLWDEKLGTMVRLPRGRAPQAVTRTG